MADSITYHPDQWSEDELLRAARRERLDLKPQVAVALLRSKLGDRAQPVLSGLASDESLDPRTRQAAVGHLRDFPAARGLLESLSRSPDEAISAAAAKALSGN
jgi:hypothetical protein